MGAYTWETGSGDDDDGRGGAHQTYSYLRSSTSFADLLEMVRMGYEQTLPFVSASHILPPALRSQVVHNATNRQSLDELLSDYIRGPKADWESLVEKGTTWDELECETCDNGDGQIDGDGYYPVNNCNDGA